MQQSLALAVLLMWSVLSMRVLRHFEWLGPFVVAIELFVSDVQIFILLIAGPMIGFAAAFVKLFQSDGPDSRCATLLYKDTGRTGALGSSAIFLFEAMLGSVGMDPLLECFEGSSFPQIAPFLLNIFNIFIVLLTLNMLIAMSERTPGTRG